MRRNILILYLVIGVAFLINGCAGKGVITRGEVDNEKYISKEAGYTVTVPAHWHPTLTAPSPDIELKLQAKLKRDREVGYILKDDGTAHIMIETYWLTWGGKPMLPLDFTWDKTGPKKMQDVCRKMLTREEKRSAGRFTDFDFTCWTINHRDMCVIYQPCLESTKSMTSMRPGKNRLLEEIYIIGPYISPGAIKNMAKDAHGWRVRFTLISPPDGYQNNVNDFHGVIDSMQQGY